MYHLIPSDELNVNSIEYLKELIHDTILTLISEFDGQPSKLIINSDLRYKSIIYDADLYDTYIYYGLIVSYEKFNGILKLE